MKKITFIFLLFLLLSLSSCSKNSDFLSNDELERFGLSNLSTPTHATNYYNKSTNTMLNCYMSVGNDDDVRNYVLDILKMLEDENVYKKKIHQLTVHTKLVLLITAILLISGTIFIFILECDNMQTMNGDTFVTKILKSAFWFLFTILLCNS